MTDTTTSTGGDAGQGKNNDGAGQQGGDGKTITSSGTGSGSDSGTSSTTSQQGKSEPTFTQADVNRLIEDRLARERKKYADYDDLKSQVDASKPLSEQVSKLQKDLAARDARDVERNGKLAMSTVHALLAEQGIRKDDVKDVLEPFDPKTLLKDGEPDDEAIARFARGLARVAGRVTADPDQGQNGTGSSPQTMGDFMRQMARNRR
jgi:hypothetical protein